MNPMMRTMTFVGLAVISVGLALTVHIVSQPPDMSEVYDPVGKEFYPAFDDPNEVKALSVVVYNEDTASIKSFEVKLTDGVFRIPSHHNYPADAEDRLAETAASVIGVTRGALQTRRESDHERYGVIDPLDETTGVLKGRGQRITLYGGDGKTALADFVIGKEVEGQTDLHYVRREDEAEVYRSNFKINLSAKFTDWIESDVLKMDRDNLVEIVVNTYSIDEQAGRLVAGEVNKLNREKVADPWKLDGLDEKTEEMKTTEINEMVNSLDDLKIVGVRPKPKGLKADLSIDPALERDPLAMMAVQAMQNDLRSKGFFFGSGENGRPRLVSNEGELICKTNEGIAYSLYFGEIFTGSEIDIEKGILSDDNKDEQKEADKDVQATSEKKSDEKGDDDQEADDLTESRYLFVRTEFDPQLLGPEPVKPVQPTKPDQTSSAAGPTEQAQPKTGKEEEDGSSCQIVADAQSGKNAAESQEADDSDLPTKSVESDAQDGNANVKKDEVKKDEVKKDEVKKDEVKKDEVKKDEVKKDEVKKDEVKKDEVKKDEVKKDEVKKDESDSESPKSDPQAEYDTAMKKYEADLKTYNDALKDYQDKLQKGREKVEKLNERFGEWYYVISADSFEKLSLSRDDMVKPKEKSEDETESDDSDTQAQDAAGQSESSPETSGLKGLSPANEKTETDKSSEAAKDAKADKPPVDSSDEKAPAADSKESAAPQTDKEP